MERSPVRDFVVGLFVLAGIVAIAYFSISIGGFIPQRTAVLKLTAAFDETGGLATARGGIAGVRIGESRRSRCRMISGRKWRWI